MGFKFNVTISPRDGKHSAKRKLLAIPPKSHFPYHSFGSFFGRRGGTGTNSPVVQELTFMLRLAAERNIFKKMWYRN